MKREGWKGPKILGGKSKCADTRVARLRSSQYWVTGNGERAMEKGEKGAIAVRRTNT